MEAELHSNSRASDEEVTTHNLTQLTHLEYSDHLMVDFHAHISSNSLMLPFVLKTA